MGSLRPLLIGLSGGSGSGKTTICKRLTEELPDCQVISSDNYYRSLDHLSPAERADVNFDHPDAIDFQLLAEHLRALKQGHSVSIPIYCFETHTRTGVTSAVLPAQTIIVEGVLVLATPEVRVLADLCIFVHADRDTRYQRRLRRDTVERGRSPENVIKQWIETVEPMYDCFVDPVKELADVVVSSEQPLELTVVSLVERIRADVV